MAKTSGKPHRRAYVNPLPGFGEAAQRAQIEAYGPVDEWYVESNSVTRADFIKHLRPGDEAVVARAACFAKSRGTNESRLADLAEARGDVHALGVVLVSADDKLDSRRHWLAMKAKARTDLVAFKNMANGAANKHKYTNAELEKIARIKNDKRYKNDADRIDAIVAAGIKRCGRTWLVEKLPALLIERGIRI